MVLITKNVFLPINANIVNRDTAYFILFLISSRENKPKLTAENKRKRRYKYTILVVSIIKRTRIYFESVIKVRIK